MKAKIYLAIILTIFCLPIKLISQNANNSLTMYKYPGNYACFKFIFNNTTIITDLYNMNEKVDPEIVTISHGDADHTDVSKLFGKFKLLNQIDSYRVENIQIDAIDGHHNKGDLGTTNIIYVFDFNGIRVAHFASQGDILTDDMYKKLGIIDILLIQCFDNKIKLSADEVIEIIKKVKAKIIIPEHGTPGYLESKFKYFVGPISVYKEGKFTITKEQLNLIKTPALRILDRP